MPRYHKQQSDAIVYITLRPRSGAVPWWASFSIRHGVKSMLLPTESLLRLPFLAIMYKRDVIHKTGSTQRIATPPEKVRARHKKNPVKIGHAVLEIC